MMAIDKRQRNVGQCFIQKHSFLWFVSRTRSSSDSPLRKRTEMAESCGALLKGKLLNWGAAVAPGSQLRRGFDRERQEARATTQSFYSTVTEKQFVWRKNGTENGLQYTVAWPALVKNIYILTKNKILSPQKQPTILFFVNNTGLNVAFCSARQTHRVQTSRCKIWSKFLITNDNFSFIVVFNEIFTHFFVSLPFVIVAYWSSTCKDPTMQIFSIIFPPFFNWF